MVHLNKEYLKGPVERLERGCGSERGDRYRERTRVSRRLRGSLERGGWRDRALECESDVCTDLG